MPQVPDFPTDLRCAFVPLQLALHLIAEWR